MATMAMSKNMTSVNETQRVHSKFDKHEAIFLDVAMGAMIPGSLNVSDSCVTILRYIYTVYILQIYK